MVCFVLCYSWSSSPYILYFVDYSQMEAERNKEIAYFASDVHLGLALWDPKEREDRFVGFLKSIPHRQGVSLYLLGDIWDFWFEYRDVVPRCGARVIAQMVSLIDSGVDVYFCPGNHDLWAFSFFSSLGVKCIQQPYFTDICGARFCLGHGDGLGGAKWTYKLLNKVFRCHFLQRCFAALHPWFAFRFGNSWSGSNRLSHGSSESFVIENLPIYKFAMQSQGSHQAQYYIFGHYHARIDEVLPNGARLVVLPSWFKAESVPYALFDGESLTSFS